MINFISYIHTSFCTARSSWLKQETDVLLRVLHQALHLSQKSPSIKTNNNDNVTICLKDSIRFSNCTKTNSRHSHPTHTDTIVGTLFLKNVAIYYHIDDCVCKWQNKKYRAVLLHMIHYVIVKDTLLIIHSLLIQIYSHTFFTNPDTPRLNN